MPNQLTSQSSSMVLTVASRELPHAMLVAYGGGHIAMLLPISRALRALGWRVTLFALTTAAAAAQIGGEPFVGFRDFKHLAGPDADRYARLLCPNIPSDGPVGVDETLAYHGTSYADLVADVGEAQAAELWNRDGRQAFLPTGFFRRVIQYLQPDIVVATNSPRSERAAILAAGELGIPALCAVDMFAVQEVKWIGQNGFASRVTVLNEAVRQMMIAHGRRPDDVVVTGNPAFDPIVATATIAAGQRLRAERRWNDGRLTALWASQVEPQRHPFTGEEGDPSLPRRIEAALRMVVDKNPALRLVVRYHPSEQVAFEPAARVEHSLTAEPLHALLHAVDIVIVTSSTVGLEGWIARRPVMAIGGSIFTADAPFAQMGIAQGAAAPEHAANLLAAMAGARPVFPLSGQQPPPPTGTTATSAIVSEILKLVN
jgi:hypothetical protein